MNENEDVAQRLEKAERAIQAARIQLEAGLPDFAVSAGYYALFYLAEALLLDRDFSFSSHGAVHGAFGREFAKTEQVDPKHHRHLLDAFQKRNEVDYGLEMDTADEVAEEIIGWAEEFLEAAQRYLE